MLGRRFLAEQRREIAQYSEGRRRRVSCAEVNSSHPPGISVTELRLGAQARAQAATGLRIESLTVSGHSALVHYSWQVPKHPSPLLSFKRPASGDRVYETVPLHLENGHWRMG